MNRKKKLAKYKKTISYEDVMNGTAAKNIFRIIGDKGELINLLPRRLFLFDKTNDRYRDVDVRQNYLGWKGSRDAEENKIYPSLDREKRRDKRVMMIIILSILGIITSIVVPIIIYVF